MSKITIWKEKLHDIIFESATPAGKAFDIILIIAIACSSLLLMAESVPELQEQYGAIMAYGDIFFFTCFSIEYVLRIFCSNRRLRYIRSFFGMIDLMAILPVFIGFFLPAANYLISVRIFRLLRIFRILRMFRYVGESRLLLRSLRASGPKIVVFVITIFSIVTIVGTLMYVVEGPENGYASIPESMYWAIVTISTVGYGDISPQTGFGKFLASVLMITAYGVLAVPTGIISYELAQNAKLSMAKTCLNCGAIYDDADHYCRKCGNKLKE
ncbi:MAG: Ion transport protein [Bacillota bacterium]|nr:Ion transport protein [Bacillota bacterium]